MSKKNRQDYDSVFPLIAAAGKGSRSGLNYPKSIFKVSGIPIISRILKTLDFFKNTPTIIINPNNEAIFKETLNNHNQKADFAYQNKPIGMGDAVLKFDQSLNFNIAEQILLIWGDIPYISKKTIVEMTNHHLANNNTLTFVTTYSSNTYTSVIRNLSGDVIDLIESREEAVEITKGERDIGIFIFKKDPVFKILKSDVSKKYGKATGEHSFLYVIKELIKNNETVDGLNIAKKGEDISLNTELDIQILQEDH